MDRSQAYIDANSQGLSFTSRKALSDFLSEYLSTREEVLSKYPPGNIEESHTANLYSLKRSAEKVMDKGLKSHEYNKDMSELASNVYMGLDKQERYAASELIKVFSGYTRPEKYFADLHHTAKEDLSRIKNSYKRRISGDGMKLENIIGLENQKREIDKFIKAVEYPDVYKENDARSFSGILLYGPPGTGKTMLGRAMADQLGIDFVEIRLSEIVSKYFGDSESIIQNMFDQYDDKAIFFFDELDGLAPDRKNGKDNSASTRIVSTLLTNLDGMNKDKEIIPIGTTNRLDDIDEALKRPGRFSKLIEVPLPDYKTRKDMFKNMTDKEIFSIKDYNSFAEMTENLSGADIKEIIERTKEDRAYNICLGNSPERIKDEDITRKINDYERL
ncbi:MAG: ATP-binding protein [Nanobdellota archaeon]